MNKYTKKICNNLLLCFLLFILVYVVVRVFIKYYNYGLFGKLIGFLTKSKAGMVVLTGVTMGLATAMSTLAIKAAASAIAKAYSAIAQMGILTGGFGLAAGLGIAAAFGTGLYAAMRESSSLGLAEGGMVKATPGGVQATIGEGGEDELVTPLSKVGQLINVDTKPMSEEIATLKGEIAKTNQAMSTLISNMESYFGFGGSAVKGIGRETIKAGSSLL